MAEWVWRVLIVLFATFWFRFFAVAYVVFVMLRSEGITDVWDLERHIERTRAMPKEEFRAKVRTLTPQWFRIIFLWRL
jgi:hypothetical protein